MDFNSKILKLVLPQATNGEQWDDNKLTFRYSNYDIKSSVVSHVFNRSCPERVCVYISISKVGLKILASMYQYSSPRVL